jgi:hypothetical protein
MVIKIRNVATIEYLNHAFTSGDRIRQANAEQRDGHVLGHGKGREQVWVLKEKAEGPVTKASELLLGQICHVLSIHPNLSRVGGLEKSEHAEQKPPAQEIRAVKFTNLSRIKESGNLLNRRVGGFFPIATMATQGFARKTGRHFRRQCFEPSALFVSKPRRQESIRPTSCGLSSTTSAQACLWRDAQPCRPPARPFAAGKDAESGEKKKQSEPVTPEKLKMSDDGATQKVVAGASRI